ncbi:MAG TPA: DUF5686 and carboxypeptidase regulatory-like domain-containing protein, partial [Chitinophagaceae bacterium]|nr:DUF5686 and carboxypeptidase regulatory-like domain-containing protein [Chitinophagaceae bacterium]
MQRSLYLLLMLCIPGWMHAQQYSLHGKVTNTRLEPLSYVTVQVKGAQIGTKTNDKGEYSFQLEEGEYELVFSLIGYRKQSIKFILDNNSISQNVMMEEGSTAMNEVKIVSFRKDRAEEYIRNIIRRKDSIREQIQSYSTEVYIRATEELEHSLPAKKWNKLSDSAKNALEERLPAMNMTEVYLKLDYQYPGKIKEQRSGIKKRGNSDGLFFLTTTDGDFSLYPNLIRIPSLSEIPMLSPVSYSGLVAYKYKTKNIFRKDNYTIYTIQFIPGRLGNALIEGELKVVDTSWTILETTYRFPKFHMPEYDFFETTQQYDCIDGKAWLPVKQRFTYYTKEGKAKMSGRTVAVYDHYILDTQFAKKYFNREISSTQMEAYRRDSNFWNTVRLEPLDEKEVKFIAKSDSVYRATHSKEYLDSIDRRTNKITLLKIAFFGQDNYKRSTERTISINPLISMYRPLLPGGTRLAQGGSYRKIFKNKTSLFINGELNYGIRNHDFMGDLRIQHIYNPFSQGYWVVDGGRAFDLIFSGDAFINLFRRSNFYIKNYVGVEHGLEIANGLVFRAGADFS